MFLVQLIGPNLRVQEFKRKLVAPVQSLYREKCGQCKVSLVWCQPIGLMQVVGMEGRVVVSAVWTEMLRDKRNSDQCDTKTQDNTHMSKVMKRKENAVCCSMRKH
jgi:hypothetical protein